MFDFTGRTVLVTGASGALGTALSARFARAASDQARFATGSEIVADGGFGLGAVA